MRQVRNDFNFAVFARSLMREKPSQEFQNLDHTLKVRGQEGLGKVGGGGRGKGYVHVCIHH